MHIFKLLFKQNFLLFIVHFQNISEKISSFQTSPPSLYSNYVFNNSLVIVTRSEFQTCKSFTFKNCHCSKLLDCHLLLTFQHSLHNLSICNVCLEFLKFHWLENCVCLLSSQCSRQNRCFSLQWVSEPQRISRYFFI